MPIIKRLISRFLYKERQDVNLNSADSLLKRDPTAPLFYKNKLGNLNCYECTSQAVYGCQSQVISQEQFQGESGEGMETRIKWILYCPKCEKKPKKLQHIILP